MQDYFKIFDLNQKYEIDSDLLEKKYLELQTKYHPDFAKSESEKLKMVKNITLINDAYSTLKDNYLRAKHLFTIKFGNFNETFKGDLDQKLLNNFLENAEEIDNSNDITSLEKLSKKLIIELEEIKSDISLSFDKNDQKNIYNNISHMQYVNRLITNIKKKKLQLYV